MKYPKLSEPMERALVHNDEPYMRVDVARNGSVEFYGPDRAVLARLFVAAPKMAVALDHVEAVMSIVPPRNSMAEYTATLAEVRTALALLKEPKNEVGPARNERR